MPLSQGATPKNQLDALPLQTVAQATAPDSTTIVGNKLTKYWGPTALGISQVNYAADPDAAGVSTCLFSNYVDVTGMNEFVALLIATIPGGAANNVPVALRIQYRNPGGSVQPRSGTFGQNNFSTAATRTPNYGVLALPMTYIVDFCWANAQGVVTAGPDCRLWFSRDGTAAAVAGQLFDCHLWACQS